MDYRYQVQIIAYALSIALCLAAVPRDAPPKPPQSYLAYTFHDLVTRSDFFVDNSLLIKYILESKDKVIVATYPRNFGKSINLDMVRLFLKIELDRLGIPVDKADRKSNIFFDLQYNLTISNSIIEIKVNGETLEVTPEDIAATFPAISISFANVNRGTIEEIALDLKKAISTAFKEHIYLYDELLEISKDEFVDKAERARAFAKVQKFSRIYSRHGISSTQEDLKDSLRFLSELLHEHFGREVFVFIDEYDIPFRNVTWRAMKNSDQFHSLLKEDDQVWAESDFSKTSDLMRAIMERVFQSNEYVKKGFLTGVLPVAKHYLFSEQTKVCQCNIVNGILSEFYGFTQPEVDHILHQYFPQEPEDKREEIMSWYYGYTSGIFTIYNPWSLVRYFNDGFKPDCYWVESGDLDFIRTFFKKPLIEKNIAKLLVSQPVNIVLKEKLHRADLLVFLNMFYSGIDSEVTEAQVNQVFSGLLHLGYLTIADAAHEYSPSVALRIPNAEVRGFFQQFLRLHVTSEYGVGWEDIAALLEQFEKMLDISSLQERKRAEEKFAKDLQHYQSRVGRRNTRKADEGYLQSVVTVVLLYMPYKHFISTRIGLNSRDVLCNVTDVKIRSKEPDIVFTYNKTLGVIMELEYKEIEKKTLAITDKSHKDIFKDYEEVNTVLHIGMSIGCSKSNEAEITVESEIFSVKK